MKKSELKELINEVLQEQNNNESKIDSALQNFHSSFEKYKKAFDQYISKKYETDAANISRKNKKHFRAIEDAIEKLGSV